MTDVPAWYRRWSRLVIAVTATAVLLFSLASWRNYAELREERMQAAQEESRRVLVAFEDHATRLFDYADSYLRAVRAFYIEHGDGQPLRQHLAAVKAQHSETFTGIVIVTDAHGRVTFDSEASDPPDVDLSDLGYFKSLRDDPEDVLVIDPTRKGRASGQFQFRLGRAIRVDGKFTGIIVLTLRPEPIKDFYRQFDLGPQGTLMMMQIDDRRLIARLPPLPDEYFLSRQDNLFLWDQLKSNPSSGLYHVLSPMDNISRTFQYKRLADYPILVQIGVADQDILAGLAGARRNIIGLTLAFAAVASTFCVLVLLVLRKNYKLEIARDASRRAAAELERANATLAQSNADLERFAYVSSHDLQTPLRIITSYAQLLEHRYRGHLDADADTFIDFIVEGGKHMSALINDLLQYARISSHGRPLQPLPAQRPLDRALATLRPVLDDAAATVTVGEMPVVLADESQMASLFQNLLDNAVKYRAPDRAPDITVTAQREPPDRWRFAVADNGIGIEAEYFDKIFEVFQRLHPERDVDGTGIGLALCQRIVRRFGGDIWVESVPGRGSTFFFTVPDGGDGGTPSG